MKFKVLIDMEYRERDFSGNEEGERQVVKKDDIIIIEKAVHFQSGRDYRKFVCTVDEKYIPIEFFIHFCERVQNDIY